VAKNTSKILKRKVEYKDGRRWRLKEVSMHVSDIQDGLKLLELSLTHQHGQRGWRFVKTNK
jgi:hypothetical protein